VRFQDDDRVVELFEGVERLCGNTEDGGQHPGWKLAKRLAYADVVFGFRRTGVLDDYDFHVGRAPVLEVVEGTLGCEHDVADMLVETLVVAVPVDEHPSRDSAGHYVELPRAGMPVRLADTPGHQRELHDAGRLTFEYRKIIFVRLLKPAPSYLLTGESPRWNKCDCELIVSAGMRGSPNRAASPVIGSSRSVR
jgi:hypothetical protein